MHCDAYNKKDGKRFKGNRDRRNDPAAAYIIQTNILAILFPYCNLLFIFQSLYESQIGLVS